MSHEDDKHRLQHDVEPEEVPFVPVMWQYVEGQRGREGWMRGVKGVSKSSSHRHTRTHRHTGGHVHVLVCEEESHGRALLWSSGVVELWSSGVVE